MANAYMRRAYRVGVEPGGGPSDNEPIQTGVIDPAELVAARDDARSLEVYTVAQAIEREKMGQYAVARSLWIDATKAANKINSLRFQYPSLADMLDPPMTLTSVRPPRGLPPMQVAAARSMAYAWRAAAADEVAKNPPGSLGFNPNLVNPDGTLAEGAVPGAGLSPLQQVGLVGLVFGVGWVLMRVFKIR